MEPQVKEEEHQETGYRFKFKDTEKWRNYLQENGFVVIANYLSDEECDKHVQTAWGMMEKLSGGTLDRNDAKTQVLSKNYPFVLHGGMIQYVGHSQMQWDLRIKCKPIYAALWETENLKTSFDGFCFMNGVRHYKARPGNAFLHSDQAPNKNFIWSYQGIMTLTKADQDGGGFVCVPKSNHYHHEYFKNKKMLKETENWFVVPDSDKVKEPLIHYEKINTEAGDFILFDSRTFHCNTVPTSKTLRVCTYICMLPEVKVPENIQKKRMEGFEKKRTSCHHPGDGFKSFPVLPGLFRAEKKVKDDFLKLVETINHADLDNEMKKLI